MVFWGHTGIPLSPPCTFLQASIIQTVACLHTQKALDFYIYRGRYLFCYFNCMVMNVKCCSEVKYCSTRTLKEHRSLTRQPITPILPRFPNWRVNIVIQTNQLLLYYCSAILRISSTSNDNLLTNGQISDWAVSIVIAPKFNHLFLSPR